MACPQNKLFAVIQGYQAFAGRSLGTLDVSEDLPSGILDRMLVDLEAVHAAVVKRSETDPKVGYKKAFTDIAAHIKTALSLADIRR